MPMNINDFRYMWRGKQFDGLALEHANLLAPVDMRGPGKERALLLLHGFSSSPAVYRQLLPKLPSYDAIVCPTLPGHGESIEALTAIKAQDWLIGVEKNCLSLIENYQKVDVIGLSLGGLLACHLSQRFNLNHLYLLAPALDLKLNISLALKSARLLHWLGFKYLRNRAGNLRSNMQKELAYRRVPIATIIEILTLINEFHFEPPTCPTDLFLGSFDEVVNSTLVAKKFSHLPNCTIHWLKESAHVLPLDSDVADIIECLQSNYLPG
jgi:carboxylesterase